MNVCNKPTNKIKIGITFRLPEISKEIFSNGIGQNALYFYTLLLNIGYDVYLIVNDSIKRVDILNNIYGINNSTLKYIDIDDFAQQTSFDIIFQLGLSIGQDYILKLRECGVKIVAYKCGNGYIMQMENALFNHKKLEVMDLSKYDEIWSIPQMVNTNLHYWKTLHRCKCIEVPFIWSPLAIEQVEKEYISNGVITNSQYKNRGPIKNIGIFEPNLNVFKWAFPALLVCENSYRSIPEKIDNVYVTNVYDSFTEKINILVKPLDLFKDKKISIDGRFPIPFFMAKYTDIAVSHQWENPLNYLYLDLAWMGWPIVHNAELCKDIGYYYEGFNYEMGGKVLTDVILNHDKNAVEYKKRNRKLIDRYLPTNKELQEKYKQLIDDLLS